jgi:hypothetical protein
MLVRCVTDLCGASKMHETASNDFNAVAPSTSRHIHLTRQYRASARGRSRATGGPRRWRFARQPIRAPGGCCCRAPPIHVNGGAAIVENVAIANGQTEAIGSVAGTRCWSQSERSVAVEIRTRGCGCGRICGDEHESGKKRTDRYVRDRSHFLLLAKHMMRRCLGSRGARSIASVRRTFSS